MIYIFTYEFSVLTLSARADITFPRVVSDLLIFAPSFNRLPCAPVASARSLPAKSTKLILLTWKINNFIMIRCYEYYF